MRRPIHGCGLEAALAFIGGKLDVQAGWMSTPEPSE